MKRDLSFRSIALVLVLVLAGGQVWAKRTGPAKPSFLKYYQPFEPNITANAPGYTLPLDLSTVVNLDQVRGLLGLAGVEDLISRTGPSGINP